MSKQNQMLERRRFLKTAAKAGLSLPFLQASTFATGMMLGRSAQAASGSLKRVINVYIPGGTPFSGGQSQWLPSDGMTMNTVTAPLESVKQHCIFFKGTAITNSGGDGVGGHGNTAKAFGGSGFSNTFDVELERLLGQSSPFPSLLLGAQSSGHGSATKKGGQEIVYQDNPKAAFDRLFGSATNVSSVGIQRSQSMMDVHKAELEALKNVLGSAESERLNEHLASVEKIKARLDQQAEGELNPACVNPDWNLGGFVYDANNTTRFTTEAKLQIDNAILALKCNLTNVVSLMLGNHQGTHAIPELNYTADYHQSIHGGQAGAFAETRAHLSSIVAYLISELEKASDDMGNSLLDSTLVFQSTDMGNGDAHTSTDAPVMLAGGGSAIRGGQVVETGRHMNVIDTMSEALGISAQVPQYGQGAVTGVIA
ncbi:DUF1552 domain-containing protein [Agaribacterium haliotis]|uniref:DUF1552 domain-containing protein n=1 Tax=Agaribacterium haliotis TaxID=2013869 RepID=UPI000BB58D35|nr:DUF1552 domain-containing protein [Agaribacterium haliotis]